MKLFIKDRLCPQSPSRVLESLVSLGLHPLGLTNGEVELEEDLTPWDHDALYHALQNQGLELMTDRESILAEKLRLLIIDMIHRSQDAPRIRYSEFLSRQLQLNYTYLSKLFSRINRITIEHFIITHKIERVKHLLLTNELTLTEIAWRLNYSSTAHLSAQFKRVTGITASLFRKKKNNGNGGN